MAMARGGERRGAAGSAGVVGFWGAETDGDGRVGGGARPAGGEEEGVQIDGEEQEQEGNLALPEMLVLRWRAIPASCRSCSVGPLTVPRVSVTDDLLLLD